MTFSRFKLQTHHAVFESMAKAGYNPVPFDVSEPPRKEFGDLTCNVAFLLSKQLRMAPPKIAQELIEKGIKPYLAEKKQQGQFSFIESVEPHPAGYVNFRFNYAVVAKDTLGYALESPDRYGYVDYGALERVVIEHTSVNPNKALHVGHMRNVILGDTLYRIMKAANNKVTVLNYVDDSGLQVADIVIGFLYAGFPREPPDGRKFDQYSGDEVYVKVNQMYEKDPTLAEKRKLVLREIEEGKSEIARFAAEITKRVLDEQLKTCWRMKVHYDILNFESQIVHSQMWSKAFELLKKEGLVRFEEEGKNKGCWVIEAEGEEDKVVVRSDGTATYIAKDIPYAAWKLGLVPDPFNYEKYAEQWDGATLYATTLDKGTASSFEGGDRVITIIDSRQARLQRIISQVLGKIGTDAERKHHHDYQHLGYEAVTLSANTARALGIDIGDRQFMHMSGRKGIYVGADFVLDHLRGKAIGEVKTRNPEFSDEQAGQIAEEIAVSAIRYNMIKQDLDKIITFDINESMSLEGDTGPYLQYAFARSQRILEKSGTAATETTTAAIDYALLKGEAEIELIKEISKMDLVVEDAAKSLSPKTLARYAYNLATTFNIFYEKVPVLRAQDAGTLAARLALVRALGIALKNALSMLGITALNKM
ncbi:arginyl-tRNA synthetase [Candidatus Nitrososphaera evergladensis SR1]|uniref:Arginine--tRNA ligase n=1 Tax=Candidatus Nitrososphaera evergladensis SR1 TaxID=1459636 RepID=A0A075MTU4_9ARCH|nr:arginine--tRNA ligase [Candidatus Nitrososphaera evergladensis]AIF85051.1 arginyl-tRNA synthetase [Candidatus Nitrososphaera evergladensis SR1]